MPYLALGLWIVASSSWWIFSLWYHVGIPTAVIGWVAMTLMSLIAVALVFVGSAALASESP